MCDEDMREFVALTLNLRDGDARKLVEQLPGPALRALRRQCVAGVVDLGSSLPGGMGCRRRRRARGGCAGGSVAGADVRDEVGRTLVMNVGDVRAVWNAAACRGAACGAIGQTGPDQGLCQMS